MLDRLVAMKSARSACAAADAWPRELSGGMARRVALARALALDPPLIYDEPLTGLDPIAAGVIMRLIARLNAALGMTSIIVSHHARNPADQRPRHRDRQRRHRVLRHAGRTRAQRDPLIRQFPAARTARSSSTAPSARRPRDAVRRRHPLARPRRPVLCCRCCARRSRPRISSPNWCAIIYKIGARSLPIIAVGGAFVGLSVTLLGYRALDTYGASNQISALVGLGLYRELAPVLTALLFIGRAGSSIAAELRLMRATDQITALGLMAIDPVAKAVAPRFWAAIVCVPPSSRSSAPSRSARGWFEAVRVIGLDGGVSGR